MDHRVLVAFELPNGEPVSESLATILAEMDLLALGHYELPEQTPPGAGRDRFLDEAETVLSELIRTPVAHGATVETRIVFGRARDKTIDRVALEEGCDVILVPREPDGIDRVFVPVRGGENVEGVSSFAAELAAASDASVTVFHETEETDRVPGEELLADAVERLTAAGLARDRISTQLTDGENVRGDILQRADEFDAIVLGESEPSLRDRVFGSRLAGVAFDTDLPTFVVRRLDD